ncbi:MAG TPA: glycosyltransferase family 9 protein, partial [Blastocatellia bacterium]
LRGFLGVLSHCRLLVCNDSGPMHLANLLDVPVVAIFGPQRPEWFGPRGNQDLVVFRPEIWCRPCIDYCVFDQPYCLRLVSTDDVYSAVKLALHRASRQKPEPTLRIIGRTSRVELLQPTVSSLDFAASQADARVRAGD